MAKVFEISPSKIKKIIKITPLAGNEIMEKLQNKIKTLREKLQELRVDSSFQKLSQKDKKVFYDSLKKLNDFEDTLIIKYLIK